MQTLPAQGRNTLVVYAAERALLAAGRSQQAIKGPRAMLVRFAAALLQRQPPVALDAFVDRLLSRDPAQRAAAAALKTTFENESGISTDLKTDLNVCIRALSGIPPEQRMLSLDEALRRNMVGRALKTMLSEADLGLLQQMQQSEPKPGGRTDERMQLLLIRLGVGLMAKGCGGLAGWVAMHRQPGGSRRAGELLNELKNGPELHLSAGNKDSLGLAADRLLTLALGGARPAASGRPASLARPAQPSAAPVISSHPARAVAPPSDAPGAIQAVPAEGRNTLVVYAAERALRITGMTRQGVPSNNRMEFSRFGAALLQQQPPTTLQAFVDATLSADPAQRDAAAELKAAYENEQTSPAIARQLLNACLGALSKVPPQQRMLTLHQALERTTYAPVLNTLLPEADHQILQRVHADGNPLGAAAQSRQSLLIRLGVALMAKGQGGLTGWLEMHHEPDGSQRANELLDRLRNGPELALSESTKPRLDHAVAELRACGLGQRAAAGTGSSDAAASSPAMSWLIGSAFDRFEAGGIQAFVQGFDEEAVSSHAAPTEANLPDAAAAVEPTLRSGPSTAPDEPAVQPSAPSPTLAPGTSAGAASPAGTSLSLGSDFDRLGGGGSLLALLQDTDEVTSARSPAATGAAPADALDGPRPVPVERHDTAQMVARQPAASQSHASGTPPNDTPPQAASPQRPEPLRSGSSTALDEPAVQPSVSSPMLAAGASAAAASPSDGIAAPADAFDALRPVPPEGRNTLIAYAVERALSDRPAAAQGKARTELIRFGEALLMQQPPIALETLLDQLQSADPAQRSAAEARKLAYENAQLDPIEVRYCLNTGIKALDDVPREQRMLTLAQALQRDMRGRSLVTLLPEADRPLVQRVRVSEREPDSENTQRKLTALCRFGVALMVRGHGGLAAWLQMRQQQPDGVHLAEELRESIKHGPELNLTHAGKRTFVTATGRLLKYGLGDGGASTSGPQARTDAPTALTSPREATGPADPVTDAMAVEPAMSWSIGSAFDRFAAGGVEAFVQGGDEEAVSSVAHAAPVTEPAHPASPAAANAAAAPPGGAVDAPHDVPAEGRNTLVVYALDRALPDKAKGTLSTYRAELSTFGDALLQQQPPVTLDAFMTRLASADPAQSAAAAALKAAYENQHEATDTTRYRLDACIRALSAVPAEQRMLTLEEALQRKLVARDLKTLMPQAERQIVDAVSNGAGTTQAFTKQSDVLLTRLSVVLSARGHGGLAGWLQMRQQPGGNGPADELLARLRNGPELDLSDVNKRRFDKATERLVTHGSDDRVAASAGPSAAMQADEVLAVRSPVRAPSQEPVASAAAPDAIAGPANMVDVPPGIPPAGRNLLVVYAADAALTHLSADGRGSARSEFSRFAEALLQQQPPVTLDVFLGRLQSPDPVERSAAEALKAAYESQRNDPRHTKGALNICFRALSDMPRAQWMLTPGQALQRKVVTRSLMTLLPEADLSILKRVQAAERRPDGDAAEKNQTALIRFGVALMARGHGGLAAWLQMRNQPDGVRQAAELRDSIKDGPELNLEHDGKRRFDVATGRLVAHSAGDGGTTSARPQAAVAVTAPVDVTMAEAAAGPSVPSPTLPAGASAAAASPSEGVAPPADAFDALRPVPPEGRNTLIAYAVERALSDRPAAAQGKARTEFIRFGEALLQQEPPIALETLLDQLQSEDPEQRSAAEARKLAYESAQGDPADARYSLNTGIKALDDVPREQRMLTLAQALQRDMRGRSLQTLLPEADRPLVQRVRASEREPDSDKAQRKLTALCRFGVALMVRGHGGLAAWLQMRQQPDGVRLAEELRESIKHGTELNLTHYGKRQFVTATGRLLKYGLGDSGASTSRPQARTDAPTALTSPREATGPADPVTDAMAVEPAMSWSIGSAFDRFAAGGVEAFALGVVDEVTSAPGTVAAQEAVVEAVSPQHAGAPVASAAEVATEEAAAGTAAAVASPAGSPWSLGSAFERLGGTEGLSAMLAQMDEMADPNSVGSVARQSSLGPHPTTPSEVTGPALPAFDLGQLVGPSWIHRQQPVPPVLMDALDNLGWLPSPQAPQTTLQIHGRTYTTHVHEGNVWLTPSRPEHEIAGSSQLAPLPPGPVHPAALDADVGIASGQGLNCLLDTVLQLARGTRRQDLGTPQAQALAQDAQELRRALAAVGLVERDGMIDVYGPGGVGLFLAQNLGVRIQVVEANERDGLLAHPVLGQEGPLVRILHTPGHFQPLWPRRLG